MKETYCMHFAAKKQNRAQKVQNVSEHTTVASSRILKEDLFSTQLVESIPDDDTMSL